MRVTIACLLAILGSSCGVAGQPESAQTVAAYEIPLRNEGDAAKLISVMSATAETIGFHVDSRTADELRVESEIAPMTINASVWRGANDDELIASVLDVARPGYGWLTFYKGEDPERSRQFQTRLLRNIRSEWSEVRTLPLVHGGIPHHRDMVLKGTSYELKPQAVSTYSASDNLEP